MTKRRFKKCGGCASHKLLREFAGSRCRQCLATAQRNSKVTHKTCGRCRAHKLLREFTLCGATLDGRMGVCRRCISERTGHTHRGPSTTTATHKTCPRCHRTKEHADFYTQNGNAKTKSRYNLSGYCRVCTAEVEREKRAERSARLRPVMFHEGVEP